MTHTPIMLLADFYKLSHRKQYPKGTTKVYSTFTPRSNQYGQYSDKVVFFGLQYFIKEYLIKQFNENFFNQSLDSIIKEYTYIVSNTLAEDNADIEHIVALHNLGYLPLEIKALPEGTLVPMRVPCLTIENTHDDFFWLTNFIETILCTTLWLPITSATLGYSYRKVLEKYAKATTDNLGFLNYQAHDFSMRGMSSEQSAKVSGAGHLLSFVGSDTIPAGLFLEEYYHADFKRELVLTSIPATEHSVMCSYGEESELILLRHLLTEVYPTGAFSVVCDTWDFWRVIEEDLPQLKDIVMSRQGKLVIRPDSGNPIDILCGYPIYDKDDFTLEDIIISADFFKDGYCLYRMANGNLVTLEDNYFKTHKKYNYDTIIGTYVSWDNIHLLENTPIHIKGLIQALYEIFGGTKNTKGYLELDSHIGAIYGDSITLERAEIICERLKEKGFASNNVVFGIGAFSYQYATRDTFGFAVKATYAIINNEEKLLFKDPKTDSGIKKSQRGMVSVINKGDLVYLDNLLQKDTAQLEQSLLKTVFKDSQLYRDESLVSIRARLNRTDI